VDQEFKSITKPDINVISVSYFQFTDSAKLILDVNKQHRFKQKNDVVFSCISQIV